MTYRADIDDTHTVHGHIERAWVHLRNYTWTLFIQHIHDIGVHKSGLFTVNSPIRVETK